MGHGQSQEEKLPFESRGQVIKELLESEEKYVVILKKMHSYYLVPLQKSKNLLSDKKKAEVIFANASKLLEIHTHFLEELNEEKDREDDEDEGPKHNTKRKNSIIKSVIKKVKSVGDEDEDDPDVAGVDEETIYLETLAEKRFGRIFVENAKAFEQQYHKYVSNYAAALKELIRCESKSKYRKFARKAAKKCGSPLTSFLVLPVLRVGEYAYLLNALVALTKEHHPDYYDCKDAQELMSEVSEYINDERRKAENINNIFQIQFSFVDRLTLIADHRILIKQGEIIWLHKKTLGGTTEETLHFYLFNDIVVFAKPVASMKQMIRKFSFQKNNYKLVKYFPLSKARLVALPGSSTVHNQLELSCGDESWVLKVHSKDEQRNYVDLFYKTSVEADLFKEVWPKSSLNILKVKKSRKERREQKKAEKSASKAALEKEEEEEDDEDDYEETDYEESEMEGSDGEDDDEFDELWENDDFIEQQEQKNPKERVIAHIEKALSAVDFGPRRPSLTGERKVSPLGRSTNPNNALRKNVSKSLAPSESKRDMRKSSMDQKPISKSFAPSHSSRDLQDEDEDEDDEEEKRKSKGGGRGSVSNREDEEEERETRKSRKSHDDGGEKEVRKSRKSRELEAARHHHASEGRSPRRRSDPEKEGFQEVDEDTPLMTFKQDGGCSACTLF